MTGSGIYLQAMIRESRKYGFEHYVVAGVPAGSSPHPLYEPPQVDGACVFFESEELDFPVPGMSDVMPYTSSLFRTLKGARLTAYKAAFSRVLRSALNRFNPDIIHANHLFLLTALTRNLFPHVPMVATCHGTDLRQFGNCPHLRGFIKRYCGELDRVIALTNDQSIEIQDLFGIPPSQIAIAGGGYDETRFTRAPKPPAGTVHLLYAGKFNRSKGLPWLLRSLMNIRDHDWHLHMAGSGSGPEFENCIALSRALGPKVTDYGHVDQARLAELMKAAHVQILPSFFEGFPLVLFEGLASGCRIIATRLSGYDEVLGKTKKQTIELIQLPPLETIDRPYARDEADLENALCNSILNMIAVVKDAPDFDDPEADEIASRFTWSRVFERILTVYADAISRRENVSPPSLMPPPSFT
jgi:glycosyltransferase involved in cell wall biosynthesis